MSQHRNAVITQPQNCNSREICLLFGLVAVNPNELSDSAGKKLSLFPVRVICTTLHKKIQNERTQQLKWHFLVLADARLLKRILQPSNRHAVTDVYHQLLLLQSFYLNPV